MSDDPTPRDGYPAQDPYDSVTRRGRTTDGTPVIVVERPSGRTRRRPDSEESVPDAFDARIDARLRRKFRLWKGIAAAILTLLGGTAGGVVKAHGDARAASERMQVRIEVLEREVGRLRDRREEPIYAPWPAAPQSPPATKGPPLP